MQDLRGWEVLKVEPRRGAFPVEEIAGAGEHKDQVNRLSLGQELMGGPVLTPFTKGWMKLGNRLQQELTLI